MKFAVCAIIKNENLYLREWVEHYINLGFDKIILYDNNDTNGEIPNIVIQDYIDQETIDIYRCNEQASSMQDFLKIQTLCYTTCLNKYRNEYDWILFVDIDEFLIIKKYKLIHYIFENYTQYNKHDAIILSWKMMGNPSKLYYSNLPIIENFNKELFGKYSGLDNCNLCFKSFVNCKTSVIFNETNVHLPLTTNVCNEDGNRCFVDYNTTTLMFPNHDVMYINHYYTKSLIEFLYKMKNSNHRYIEFSNCLTQYKDLNGWTEEHERVYQKFLKDNNIEVPE